MSLIGKRLLVLGGTTASLDLIKNAKEMGVYTIVAALDVFQSVGQYADEIVKISTNDIEELAKYIKEHKIDGAFCGPSEFNIRNLLKLCEQANLPCYTTTEIWDNCANKDVFKEYCRKYNVDCTPEYAVSEDSTDDELIALDYPIIVKPVDGCSSSGITTCTDWTMVRQACVKARAESKRKKIIVEKYIENSGELFSVRYLLHDGNAYPYFLMDTYIADPINKKSLISHLTVAPSKYTDYYLDKMDANVRKMLKGMGLKNGTAFIQSLPLDGKIYFHEMGYRLSGGMIYKLTNPLVHVNDMKMMIAYALGETYYTEEMEGINLHYSKKAAQLMIPLVPGTISRIEGLNEILQSEIITDFIQYYNEGESVTKEDIGTLAQHFGRFTIICDDKTLIMKTIEMIQSRLKVYDINNHLMNCIPFSLQRL